VQQREYIARPSLGYPDQLERELILLFFRVDIEMIKMKETSCAFFCYLLLFMNFPDHVVTPSASILVQVSEFN
jgi:hypothetical protein